MLLLASVTVAEAEFTVFAAASMTDAMKELADVYEPNSQSVHFNFSGSGTLARQIESGARGQIEIVLARKTNLRGQPGGWGQVAGGRLHARGIHANYPRAR